MVRTALALTGAMAAVVSATAAAAPRVDVMVVGRGGEPYLAPVTVRARAVTVQASAKRCGVASATPLAALIPLQVSMSVRDYGGSCSRRPADGGALFVVSVFHEANRGRDGWVYKVGNRSGTAGAADPAGPFGRGRLRAGANVTWFWCRMRRSGSCQRTLSVSSRRSVSRGTQLKVRVRGYDDFGHGVRVAGAAVGFGAFSAVTGSDGVAYVRAPSRTGRVWLTATRRGMVRAFARRIRVG